MVDKSTLAALSNRFYTIIPHDFGMSAPAIIDSDELIASKTAVCGFTTSCIIVDCSDLYSASCLVL